MNFFRAFDELDKLNTKSNKNTIKALSARKDCTKAVSMTYTKIAAFLYNNGIEFSISERTPTKKELILDLKNSRCWTIAYTLTLDNNYSIDFCNHTSDGPNDGSFGFEVEGQSFQDKSSMEDYIINLIATNHPAFKEFSTTSKRLVTEDFFDAFNIFEESYNAFGDRDYLIARLKDLGKKNYYFDKYSNEQLYYMVLRAEAAQARHDALADYYSAKKVSRAACPDCNNTLTDGGYCPVCDDGAEDLLEDSSLATYRDLINKGYSIMVTRHTNGSTCYWITPKLTASEDNKVSIDRQTAQNLVAEFNLIYDKEVSHKLLAYYTHAKNIKENWADNKLNALLNKSKALWTEDDWDTYFYCMHANAEREFSDSLEEDFFNTPANKLSSWVSMNTTTGTSSKPTTKNSKNIVTIYYDYKTHKLRAKADDGIHGEANVAFPNSLRNQEDQQYEVENLIWNGKNYRISGDIKVL